MALSTVATLSLIVAALSLIFTAVSTAVAVRQYLGRQRAEQARERMVAELSTTRQELAGARRAQEQLAYIEDAAAREAREAARRELRLQRSHNRAMQAQAKKQAKAAENLTKETKRQNRRKK